MKKFDFDLSAVLFVVMELFLAVDIALALCQDSVTITSYVCTAWIAMMGFLQAEILRQSNKKNRK